MHARRGWKEVFSPEGKDLYPRLLCPTKLSFRMEGQIKCFPNKLDPRTNSLRYIIIKMPKIKDKERIVKAARDKETVTYKGVPIRLSADFSKETL